MKNINKFITEYIVKKKLDKFIDSEDHYKYFPKTKEELTKNIQELISNKIYDFNCIDTSEITDMSNLFGDIVNNIDRFNFDVSKWDVSNVTNMAFMFVGCESFEGKGLENWDVSNVENTKYMFNDCKKLNCDLSNWNMHNVTNMEYMFYGCKQFEGKGLENWDVSNVEISSFMFLKCENLNCDLSKWDVRNIRRMSSMFSYCKKFDGKSIENWDVSNVVSLRNMFKYCENFNCDLSNCDVRKVKDMTNMFYGCKSLKNKPSWYKG